MFRAALAVFKHQVIAYPWLVLLFIVIFSYPPAIIAGLSARYANVVEYSALGMKGGIATATRTAGTSFTESEVQELVGSDFQVKTVVDIPSGYSENSGYFTYGVRLSQVDEDFVAPGEISLSAFFKGWLHAEVGDTITLEVSEMLVEKTAPELKLNHQVELKVSSINPGMTSYVAPSTFIDSDKSNGKEPFWIWTQWIILPKTGRGLTDEEVAKLGQAGLKITLENQNDWWSGLPKFAATDLFSKVIPSHADARYVPKGTTWGERKISPWESLWNTTYVAIVCGVLILTAFHWESLKKVIGVDMSRGYANAVETIYFILLSSLAAAAAFGITAWQEMQEWNSKYPDWPAVFPGDLFFTTLIFNVIMAVVYIQIGIWMTKMHRK